MRCALRNFWLLVVGNRPGHGLPQGARSWPFQRSATLTRDLAVSHREVAASLANGWFSEEVPVQDLLSQMCDRWNGKGQGNRVRSRRGRTRPGAESPHHRSAHRRGVLLPERLGFDESSTRPDLARLVKRGQYGRVTRGLHHRGALVNGRPLDEQQERAPHDDEEHVQHQAT